MKVLLALAFSIHLSIAGGAGTVVEAKFCTESCPDDDSDGQCAPMCSDCTCCAHPPLMTIASEMKLSLTMTGSNSPELKLTLPLSPEPDDILHVPKTQLA